MVRFKMVGEDGVSCCRSVLLSLFIVEGAKGIIVVDREMEL